jgi:hypothetical protein
MHENELPFVNGGQHIAWAPDIPILVSLGTILGILVITTVASLIASNRGVENDSQLAAALDDDAESADRP